MSISKIISFSVNKNDIILYWKIGLKKGVFFEDSFNWMKLEKTVTCET